VKRHERPLLRAGRLIRFDQRANRLAFGGSCTIKGFKRFGRTFGRQKNYQTFRLLLGTQILDNLTSPDGLATNHVNGISITRNPVLYQYGFKCGKRRSVGEKAANNTVARGRITAVHPQWRLRTRQRRLHDETGTLLAGQFEEIGCRALPSPFEVFYRTRLSNTRQNGSGHRLRTGVFRQATGQGWFAVGR
jgi:hypothetical protein